MGHSQEAVQPDHSETRNNIIIILWRRYINDIFVFIQICHLLISMQDVLIQYYSSKIAFLDTEVFKDASYKPALKTSHKPSDCNSYLYFILFIF